MEFENALSRTGKIAEVIEKSWNFNFVPFEDWKHSPYHQAKICPKMVDFQQQFLVMENFKLIMEKSLNFAGKGKCELKIASCS